jgi:tRNA(Arg) A34 adenosine deaminase TadA
MKKFRKHKETKIKATVYNKKGQILAIAYNSYSKTHPIQAKYAKEANIPEKIYLHAEISAIIKAKKIGKPYKIKIERYYKDGKPALAKPCPACELAIREANIKYIEYTVG